MIDSIFIFIHFYKDILQMFMTFSLRKRTIHMTFKWPKKQVQIQTLKVIFKQSQTKA